MGGASWDTYRFHGTLSSLVQIVGGREGYDSRSFNQPDSILIISSPYHFWNRPITITDKVCIESINGRHGKKARRGSTKSNVKTDGAEIGGKTSLTQLPDEQI